MATLLFVQGPDAGKRHTIQGDATIIGRQGSADIVINLLDVSRRHAQITRAGNEHFIEDLGSSNGTFLNGLKLEAKTPLHAQDVIRIGPCELLFDLASADEAEPLIQAQLSTHPGNKGFYEQDAASKLQAVLGLAHHLAQTSNIDQLYERLFDHLFGAFPKADRALVLLREGQRLSLRASRSRGLALIAGEVYSRSVIRRVLDQGVGVVALDNSALQDEGATLRAAGIRSFLCVPLKWRGDQPRGVLQLDTSRADASFTKEDLHLLSAVGLQVSAVLENTALHNELLEHERVKRDLALARLGQLAAGVAHEINNPLSFVLNNTVIIERDVDALARLIELFRQGEAVLSEAKPELVKEIHDFAEEIDLPYTLSNLHALLKRSREGLKRITQIVQDLRSFARLNESEVDEVDLNPCLKATIGIAQGLAEKRGVTLQLELGTLPRVSCQPARINQAVFNILANAIDASPEGAQVVIRSSVTGDMVEVHISDRGPGIDPAIRDKIFDPFFTTKPLGKGVGLGLSIAHGIVSDHGGAIEAISQQGQGTEFIVRLPSRSHVQSHST